MALSQDRLPSEGEAPQAADASKALLMMEYSLLGTSLFVYEILGRSLFFVAILAGIFLKSIKVPIFAMILLVGLYAAFWLCRTFVAYRRQRLIFRLIAESSYFENREWGSL